MVPPLALLAYAPEQPKVAAFWPYAVFSPEWQAMVWAQQRGIEVRFADLPAAMVLAPQPRTLFDDDPICDRCGPTPRRANREPRPSRRHRVPDPSHDPLGALAAAAGYDDPERWWEDLVESRLDGSSPFPLLIEAMAELRRLVPADRAPRAAPRGVHAADDPRRPEAGSRRGSRWSAAPGTPRS